MKRNLPLTTTFVAAALLTGCATSRLAPHAVASLGGPDRRVVDLPGSPGLGPPREVTVLLDEPAVKLATIVLRGGTVLPSHHAAVPVTITALRGSGTVIAGPDRLPLDATHAVVLGAGVAHVVEPDAGAELVLLVHHLGRDGAHRP